MLKRKFSPSAIAGKSKHEHGEALVSHETIYQWVYQDKRKGGNLHRLLLRAKRGYRKSRKVTDNRELIANRVSIDQREKRLMIDFIVVTGKVTLCMENKVISHPC